MSDDRGNLSSTEATQVENLESRWLCPWGSSVVDDVAPVFRSILEESHASSGSLVEDTRVHRHLWWKKRKKLDHHLRKFVRLAGFLSITRVDICLLNSSEKIDHFLTYFLTFVMSCHQKLLYLNVSS